MLRSSCQAVRGQSSVKPTANVASQASVTRPPPTSALPALPPAELVPRSTSPTITSGVQRPSSPALNASSMAAPAMCRPCPRSRLPWRSASSRPIVSVSTTRVEDVQPEGSHQPVAGLGHDAGQREQERQQRDREDDEGGADDLGAQDAPHDRS